MLFVWILVVTAGLFALYHVADAACCRNADRRYAARPEVANARRLNALEDDLMRGRLQEFEARLPEVCARDTERWRRHQALLARRADLRLNRESNRLDVEQLFIEFDALRPRS